MDLNSLVLSDEQRASVTDPVIRQLLPLIPRANVITSAGTPRFVGSAPAVVDVDRWTADVRHNVADRDRLHVFIGHQYWRTREPTNQGNSIPGFGSKAQPDSNVLTAGHTHVFQGATTNEIRYGRTHVNGGTFPAATLNPIEFGIGNGVTRALGLPQMIVAGDLNFGGPGPHPQGRFDTLHVLTDTFTHARGRHTIKTGGEYRHFINENFAEGTGTFNFPSMDAFMRATANSFSITLGERRSLIDQRALALFGQDQIAIGNDLRIDLGLRYEWHVTPVERDDRFIVFDRATASLIRVGTDIPRIYQQNNANVEPRLGVTWSLPGDGNTVLRAAYGHAVDQPVTTAVRDTASNPPYGVPLTATGAVPLGAAIDTARPAGLSPSTVDPGYKNASLRAWNVNLQRQLTPKLAVMGGYSGSHGSNLRISRNINQPVTGVRPFAAIAATSAIAPGAVLGNITEVTSLGFSNYDAAWISISRRDARGLQLEASYTLSKSRDTNSLNSIGFAVQNGNDIAAEYGPSDFDARHRFVLSATYALPFTGNVVTRGWRLAAVVQSQSGNPFNIVTSTTTVNGTPNTVRPDVTGPIRIIGSVDQWFDPAPFVAAGRFGTLPRNALVGPAFNNTDITVIKEARPGGCGCSSGPTCSTCSTTRTSRRRGTSSAARRLVRSRARGFPPERPGRRVRSSCLCASRSEMKARPAAALAIAVTAILAPLASAPVLAQAPRAKNVLVIHLGAESFPANPLIDRGIHGAFVAHPEIPISYYAEYFEDGVPLRRPIPLRPSRTIFDANSPACLSTSSSRTAIGSCDSRSPTAPSCFPTRRSCSGACRCRTRPRATPEPASPASRSASTSPRRWNSRWRCNRNSVGCSSSPTIRIPRPRPQRAASWTRFQA